MTPHRTTGRRRQRFGVSPAVAASVCGLAAVAIAFTLTRFSTADVTYRDSGGSWTEASLPLRLTNRAADETVTVRFTAHSAVLGPTRFSLQPDDCLRRLSIDGTPVTDAALPYCDYANPLALRLPALRGGTHTVEADIVNTGGDALFALAPRRTDPAACVPLLLLALWATGSVFLWLRQARAPGWLRHAAFVTLAGIGIRAWYVLRTPYWIRGHDTDGHIEYIRHLLDHRTLPPPDGGWEFWQPPLYYLAGAAWSSLGGMLGMGAEAQLRSLQWLAFAASAVTLLLALWIGRMVLRRNELLPLWMTVFAFLPSAVFLSARINNDVLVVPLTLLSIALLLRWLKDPRLDRWILAAGSAGLAILTKNTGLLLLPIALCFLFLRRWRRLWHPFTHLVLGGVIVAAVAGWFSVYRIAFNPDQRFIVGNQGTLSSGLAVPNTPEALLTFNPVAVAAQPFNNPWRDDARRQYFPEYLYRSALFGEFHLGDGRALVSSWLAADGLLLLALAVAGCVTCVRHRPVREWLPMTVLFGVLLFGHIAFRIRYPFSPSQDFRYSVPLLLPFAYFLCAAFDQTMPAALRKTGEVAVSVAAALSLMILLSL